MPPDLSDEISTLRKRLGRRRHRERSCQYHCRAQQNSMLKLYILGTILHYLRGGFPVSSGLSISRSAANFARRTCSRGTTSSFPINHFPYNSRFAQYNKPQSTIQSDRTRRTRLILKMVLTTPESIIEQASTEKLIDILIDESVRTSARRPIMMQVGMCVCLIMFFDMIRTVAELFFSPPLVFG